VTKKLCASLRYFRLSFEEKRKLYITVNKICKFRNSVKCFKNLSNLD